jgi:hypothetical protein
MKPSLILAAALWTSAFLPADVSTAQTCVPTGADPATYLTVVVAGRTFYQEERGNPVGTPVPFSGLLLGPDLDGDGVPEFGEGQGSWTYEETNGLEGLQRGGVGLFGDDFPPGSSQPLIVGEDPINDETCGGGPDSLEGGGPAKPGVCAGSYTLGATVKGPKDAWANTELYCVRADGGGAVFVDDCKATVLAVPEGETVGSATCNKTGSFNVSDRVRSSCDQRSSADSQKPTHTCSITT